MTVVRLSLWGKFATEDGEKLYQSMSANMILLACGLTVSYYQGIIF